MCSSYIAQALVLINTCMLKRDALKLPNTMPELVEKTLNYINNHLPDYITLDELSKELYHNGIYISRRFKEITGLTIKEYTLRKRISLAQHYLIKGYSVADSAQKRGLMIRLISQEPSPNILVLRQRNIRKELKRQR